MTFLKPLLTSTAALALMTGATFAESHTGGDTMTGESADSAVVAFDYDTTFSDVSGMTAGELTGTPVLMQDGERIGEIDRVGNQNGEPVLIVGIGGFLGMGEHSVAMNLDELSFDQTEEAFIVQGFSEEQLKEMPEYNEEQIAFLDNDETLSAAWGSDMMAAHGNMTADTDHSDMAATDTSDAIEQDLENAGDDIAAAVNEVGQEIEDGANEVADAADAAGQEIEEGASEMAQAGDTMMDEAEAEATDLTAEVQDNMEIQENPVVAGDTETMTQPAFDYRAQYADIADMPVNDIIGTQVFAANGEDVGEIDNVGILDAEPVVVVGIGGFLGLGEHSVALNLDRMEYDAERRALVVSGYSEDELKAMPEYNRDTIGFLESEASLSDVWDDADM